MPVVASTSAPLLLVHGDDEFAVKQRARQVFQAWSAELGGMDHEIIDAQVTNGGEALKVLGRLREALQTLPFFGSGKVVWLQNCNFFGDDRTASSQAVTETLSELAQELKAFRWDNVRLLVSAGKVDKRKVFYKTLEKAGTYHEEDLPPGATAIGSYGGQSVQVFPHTTLPFLLPPHTHFQKYIPNLLFL